MIQQRCMVMGCMYLAEAAIEDFVVCVLHDHAATRTILEAGRRPGSYWTKDGFPAVIPCGILDEDCFTLKPAGPDAISATECPMIAAVPDGPSDCHEAYDLTR